jgi:hypothetical protein
MMTINPLPIPALRRLLWPIASYGSTASRKCTHKLGIHRLR